MIDYTAPAPLSSPQPAMDAPIPAGPPMGTPLPPPPGAMPGGAGAPPPNPMLLPLLAAAMKAKLGGAPMPGAGGPPNGIPGATGPGAAPYPTMPHPSTMQYTNETQQDGTVLLRVKNPDGSPGPVVQIVKPPTAKAGK